jgi:hypothetical protein
MTFMVVLFIFFFKSSFSRESDDTTKKAVSTYDINDPRNPDCPCHKYQKLADEEYARLTKNKNPELAGTSVFEKEDRKINDPTQFNTHSESNIETTNSGHALSQDKINKKSRDYFFSIKRKWKKKKYDHFQIVSGTPHLKLWRRNKTIDSCFKWK